MKVRIIIDTYYTMVKGDYDLSPSLEESNPNIDENPMIGALYKVIGSSEDGRYYHFDMPNADVGRNSMLCTCTKHPKKVQNCPFQVGDLVRLRRDLPPKEQENLSYFNQYNIDKYNLKIKHIINKFYVKFEDNPSNNKIGGAVIQWTDLEKVNEKI